MHVIRVETEIAAPPERVFDLARDVQVHAQTAAATKERVIAGKTSGLLELGDMITFEGDHLSVRQKLTAKITRMDRPTYFQDRMVRGAFKSLEHDHHFEPLKNGGTLMIDVISFAVPMGVFGWPVGQWIVGPHLRKFLIERGRALKAIAEGKSGPSPSGRG